MHTSPKDEEQKTRIQLTSSLIKFPEKCSMSSSVTSGGTNVRQNAIIASVLSAEGLGSAKVATKSSVHLNNCVFKATFVVSSFSSIKIEVRFYKRGL